MARHLTGRGGGRGRGGKRKIHAPVQKKKEEAHCSVCTTGPPKYKCPQCRAFYCCIACCRRHKKEFCGKQVAATISAAASETNSTGNLPTVPRSKYVRPPSALQELLSQQSGTAPPGSTGDFNDLAPDWKITQDMKDALDNSTWLRLELEDPGLRALLTRIVHTPYETPASTTTTSRRRGTAQRAPTSQRELVLGELRETHAPLGHFVDKTLVLAGVLQRSDDANMPIEQWLHETNVPQGLVFDK